MTPELWPACDAAADDIAALLDDLMESDAAKPLRDKLAELRETLGEDLCPQLQIEFGIGDEYRFDRDALVLLTAELSASAKGEVKLAHTGSTSQTYIVDGVVHVVPHDRCPGCWGKWDFKLIHPTCPDCGATLGEEVKHVLESDICPCCEKEAISPEKLTCEACHVTYENSWFAWDASALETAIDQ